MSLDKTFHDYLELSSASKPCRWRIKNGDYRILDASTGHTVDTADTQQWHAAIRPGAKLLLSVVMGTRMYYKKIQDICPRCNSRKLGNGYFYGWREW